MGLLKDLGNEFSSALDSAGSAIGNGVQGVESFFNPPPIQSPIPQQQSLIQPPPPMTSLMDFLGHAAQGASNFVQNDIVHPVQNFIAPQDNYKPDLSVHYNPQTDQGGATPAIPGVEQYIKNNGVHFADNIQTGNPITDWMARTAAGVPQYIANSPLLAAKAVGQGAQDISNGQIINPSVAASDVANLAMPVATLATLGAAPEAIDALNATKGFLPKVIQGITGGAKVGASFGALGAVGDNRDVTDPLQYAANVASGTVQGAGAGAFLGGVTGGISGLPDVVKKQADPIVSEQAGQDIQNGDKDLLNHDAIAPYKKALTLANDPESQNVISDAAENVTSQKHMGDSEPNKIVSQATADLLPSPFSRMNTIQQSQTWLYLIDRMNGRTPEHTPEWMKPFDNAIFDISGSKAMQAGKINFGAKIGEEEPTTPQAPAGGGTLDQAQNRLDQINRKATGFKTPDGEVQGQFLTRDEINERNALQDRVNNDGLTQTDQARVKRLNQELQKSNTNPNKIEEMLNQKRNTLRLNNQLAGQVWDDNIEGPTRPDPIAVEDNRTDKSQDGIYRIKDVVGYKDIKGDDGQIYRRPSVTLEQVDASSQPLSQEASVSDNGVRTNRMPTQTEIKNRAEINAGNPDLYTQRKIKIAQADALPFDTPEFIKKGEQLKADIEAKRQAAGLPSKEELPNIKISNQEQNPDNVTKPNATVRDARAAMDTAKTQIEQRGRNVQQLVKEGVDQGNITGKENTPTNYGENRLFRQAIQHPEQESRILTTVKNPTKFKDALDAFREFTKFNLDTAQGAGSKIKGIMNYYSHIWDLSDPADKARFETLVQAKAKNYKGWFNNPRVFNNIEEGEAQGFHLKNANVANDIAEYTNAFSKEHAARVLSNELTKNFPDKAVVADGEAPPANTIQLRLPGNNTKGLYVTPELHKQLADLEEQTPSRAGKIISTINNIDKESRLSGGLFHIKNTGADYIASQVGYGRFPRVIRAVQVFLSPHAFTGYMRDAINDGTLDKMAKANITISTKQDFAGDNSGVAKIKSGIGKFNPFAHLNDATFGRLENFFKVEAFKALDNRGLIDTSTPKGIKEAQGYGREINNMFGGQNRIVGDDIFNKSPVGKFIGNNVALLAPDYQQGRFKRTLSALGVVNGENGGWNNPLHRTAANNYAAITLATRIALTAVMTEAIGRAVTGNFSPNLISAVQNDILDPSYPSPWKNKAANGTEQNELVHEPGTNISDMYKLATDPSHFLISHTPAGLSDYVSYAGNQDYYGNKLSETNNPGEKLLKIAGNNLPIPIVQGQKVLSGREAPGNAVLNELGSRVSLDPNDPTALYFNAQKQGLQNLLSQTPDPKMQNELSAGMQQLQSVSAINPNDPRRKQVEYTTYAAFPQLFQVQQQAALAQAGGDPSKVDPLYTSPNAAKYIEYEQLSSSAPGSSEEKDYLNQHPEIVQLIKDRAAYYQANPIAQNPNAPAYTAPPQPNAYVQQQLAAKNFQDPQVQQYLTAHNDFINGQRQTIGLPMLNSYGQNPMEAAKSNAQFQNNQNRTLAKKIKYIGKEANYQNKKAQRKIANNFKLTAPKAANGFRIKPGFQQKAPMKSFNIGKSTSAKYTISKPLQNPTSFKIGKMPTMKTAGYKPAFQLPHFKIA